MAQLFKAKITGDQGFGKVLAIKKSQAPSQKRTGDAFVSKVKSDCFFS